ncbi:DNA-binding protein [Pseudomonas sp. 2FE]|uniref:DNA-binding protein n=1 Tax=Pseudomonas sp. 2FE TaxID=2502190 RepID=UPI0010F6C70B|nr:DNA-binding protein [Pseudomonas sp. 2FE]
MLLLTGLCHGYKANKRTVGANEFTDHLLLIEVQDTNQFGIPETKTVGIKLAKSDVEQGIQHVYDQFKGKAVSAPVRVGPWASKAGNAGFDYWLSGDRRPVNMQIAKPVQAAS